jgi:hypothetical protein
MQHDLLQYFLLSVRFVQEGLAQFGTTKPYTKTQLSSNLIVAFDKQSLTQDLHPEPSAYKAVALLLELVRRMELSKS